VLILSAFDHLAVAQRAHDRIPTKIGEREPAGDDPLIVVVFAAMAIEGFINELAECAALAIQDYDDEPPTVAELARVLADTESARGSTGAKYMAAYRALTGHAYNRGHATYQNFAMLTETRNALVHLKPERWVSGGLASEKMHRQAASIRKTLEKRKLTCEAAAIYPWSHLTDLIRTRAVARWAIETAWAIMKSMVDAIPESECRKIVLRSTPPLSKAGIGRKTLQ
jgi:hypothetical protein